MYAVKTGDWEKGVAGINDTEWTGKEQRSLSQNEEKDPKSHLDKEDQQKHRFGSHISNESLVFPPISLHSFSVHHFLCIHAYVINPCLYQSTVESGA